MRPFERKHEDKITFKRDEGLRAVENARYEIPKCKGTSVLALDRVRPLNATSQPRHDPITVPLNAFVTRYFVFTLRGGGTISPAGPRVVMKVHSAERWHPAGKARGILTFCLSSKDRMYADCFCRISLQCYQSLK